MSPEPDAAGLVCLGASAGGLRSIEAVVSRLPADMPWPVLVSQHLQPDRVSQLPGILARVSGMRVREAVDGETLVGGTIYTSPSSSEMGVTSDGRISHRPPVAGKPQRIDHLFATASFARPGRVVAVVLSGTGSDGAVGSLVVKLHGGTVIAESDQTAQYGGMPAAAQRAGTVDATLTADAIAPLLVELARGALADASATKRAILRDIAQEITDASGTDFARYRLGTLRRRAENRRAIVGDPTLGAYRERLAMEPAEREALVRSLLIPVTEFFRDPPAWNALAEHVLPALAERTRAGEPVRIWCAGCASGEEAYTIAILVAEGFPDRRRVEILATDLDPSAIAAATEGTYDAARVEGIDAGRRGRFFRAKGHGYRVGDELRALVQFRTHDVTRDPAPGKFHLIVCRNLLIYFDEALQARTIEAFRDALVPGGALFLGGSEAIPRHQGAFEPLVRPMRIFRATPKAGAAAGGHSAVWITPAAPGPAAPSDVEVEELREDLAATNDELQSTNEELAATNEELQAANEELATLNEEFQSTNQALASTNAEQRAVATSARSATDLMREILQARREAIVGCDPERRVTLYNRRAADLFGLDPSCVGRPLHAVGLGPTERDLDGWLSRAASAPVTQGFDHPDGKLELVVERLTGPAGRPLGWVLTWTQRA